MPGGLQGVQRKHEPNRRILRKPHVLLSRFLPRCLHQPEVGPELRRLRTQLPGAGADLLRRSLRRSRRRCLQLRTMRQRVSRTSAARIRRVRLRIVRLRLCRRRHRLQRDMHAREFGSPQLRRLRKRLCRTDSALQRRRMQCVPRGRYALRWYLHQPQL